MNKQALKSTGKGKVTFLGRDLTIVERAAPIVKEHYKATLALITLFIIILVFTIGNTTTYSTQETVLPLNATSTNNIEPQPDNYTVLLTTLKATAMQLDDDKASLDNLYTQSDELNKVIRQVENIVASSTDTYNKAIGAWNNCMELSKCNEADFNYQPTTTLRYHSDTQSFTE